MTLGRVRLAAGALLLALAGGAPASGWAAPAQVTCPGVWVLVDAGERGGVRTGCAREHANGVEALRSAGFAVELRDGMICRIDGVPASCTLTMIDYWSYWHAERGSDGLVSPWTYSTLGAGSYAPGAGEVEGWYFGEGGRVPPAPLPADHLAADARTGSPAATPAAGGSPAPSTTPAANEPAPGATTTGSTTGSPADPGPLGTLIVVGLLAVACVGWWFTRGRRR